MAQILLVLAYKLKNNTMKTLLLILTLVSTVAIAQEYPTIYEAKAFAEIQQLKQEIEILKSSSINRSSRSLCDSSYCTEVINIGSWNMDAVPIVVVPHGLIFDDIISVQILIRNDDNTAKLPIECISSVYVGGFYQCTLTDIIIYVTNGAIFDTIGFDNTGFNRGYIVIDHK